MYERQFRAQAGSRIGALLLGAVLLLAAGVFLTFGVVLIVGLMIVGLVIGIAASLYRRLAGAPPAKGRDRESFRELDPAMEVVPPPHRAERQEIDVTDQRHKS